MPNNVTTSADLFMPQVVGDHATDILLQRDAMLRSRAVTVMPGDIWARGGNDKLDIPTFTTDLSDMVKAAVRDSRAGVDPEKVTMDSYQEDVLSRVISIDADSLALEDAPEYVQEHLSAIIAERVSASIQADLIAKAAGTSLELDITGETDKALTVDGLLRAKMKWGDYFGEAEPVAFLHPKQFEDLALTEDFKELGSAATGSLVTVAAGASPIAARVHGIDIVVLNGLPVTAGTPDKLTALLCQPGALPFSIRKNPETHLIRHPGSAVVTLDTTFRWVSTLARRQPRPVVKLITE